MLHIKIDDLIKESIKEKDMLKSLVLRDIKNEFLKFKTQKNQTEVLDENKSILIIQKMIKNRKESINQFTQANRLDLIEKEMNEITILETFVPEQPSEQEIISFIDDIMVKNNYTSKKDMKNIMNELKTKYPTINSSDYSKLIIQKLS